jgi:hypothetical protein
MKASCPAKPARLALRRETLCRQNGGDPTDDKDDAVKGPVPSNYCPTGAC